MQASKGDPNNVNAFASLCLVVDRFGGVHPMRETRRWLCVDAEAFWVPSRYSQDSCILCNVAGDFRSNSRTRVEGKEGIQRGKKSKKKKAEGSGVWRFVKTVPV